jgi:hypothetical protein
MAQRDDIARLLHDAEYPPEQAEGGDRSEELDWDGILATDRPGIIRLLRVPRFQQADALLAAYRMTEHEELETAEYQAACGSWVCRAPECGPMGG